MSDKTVGPPRFRRKLPPKAPSLLAKQERGKFRSSPRSRGYTSKWDRLSIAYRKRHPFCEECARHGIDTLAAVTDHIIPVQDRPDLLLEWKNLQSLCDAQGHGRNCHGWKLRMETYARQTGQIDKLPLWCEQIDQRPVQFRRQ